MSERENIEIFEKIWNVDIINKNEPLYSIAVSVAQSWELQEKQGASSHKLLKYILLRRLLDNWENKLVEHINHYPIGMPGGNGLGEFFRSLREKYKDSPPLLFLVNKIITNITSGPMLQNQDQHPNIICVGAHNNQ